MSSQHYALVPSGIDPLPVPPVEDEKDVRSELNDLYQFYADLYPNPKLVEESRMRDTLLQAASAARNFKSSNKKKKKSSGFFAWIFGCDAEEDEDDTMRLNLESSNSMDPLVYTDILNENDDGSLCGTMQSIDLSCIPMEAYSVARFHLP